MIKTNSLQKQTNPKSSLYLGLVVLLLYPISARADVARYLLKAAKADNSASYHAAREEALALNNQKFASLLSTLGKEEGWQAMAIRDGLKLRRKKPEIVERYDGMINGFLRKPLIKQSESVRRYTYVTSTEEIIQLRQRIQKESPVDYSILEFELYVTKQPFISKGEHIRRIVGDNDLRAVYRKPSLPGMSELNLLRLLNLLESPPDWLASPQASANIASYAKKKPEWFTKPILEKTFGLYCQFRKTSQQENSGRTSGHILLAYGRLPPAQVKPYLDRIVIFEKGRPSGESNYRNLKTVVERTNAALMTPSELAAKYKQLRENGKMDEETVDSLRVLVVAAGQIDGGKEENALKQMVELERKVMKGKGLSPWNDMDQGSLYYLRKRQAIDSQIAKVKRELEKAQDQENDAVAQKLKASIETLTDERDQIKTKRQAYRLWRSLQGQLKRVRKSQTPTTASTKKG